MVAGALEFAGQDGRLFHRGDLVAGPLGARLSLQLVDLVVAVVSVVVAVDGRLTGLPVALPVLDGGRVKVGGRRRDCP